MLYETWFMVSSLERSIEINGKLFKECLGSSNQTAEFFLNYFQFPRICLINFKYKQTTVGLIEFFYIIAFRELKCSTKAFLQKFFQRTSSKLVNKWFKFWINIFQCTKCICFYLSMKKPVPTWLIKMRNLLTRSQLPLWNKGIKADLKWFLKVEVTELSSR